ncbi:CLUMA_CG010919, isoform A [Clunio marinus]|uniref:CLUMA_CG010919, isoform A n=1 Tax=Clunio marinus TaxID=568069 RepID=A0A1J1IBE2_9DIPT|nr:CLUMA_CG010919, isoform A [Clunio marinus]
MRQIIRIILLFCLLALISAKYIEHKQQQNDDSEETSFELDADFINLPQRAHTKRESEVSEVSRPTRELTFRAHFYNLLMNILDTIQSSTKRDIRRAKEQELQKHSFI